MKKYLIAAAVAVASMSSQAQVYGELGVTFTNVEVDMGGGYMAESSPTALRAILGYEINKNLALEGMLGFGLGDDSITVSGYGSTSAKMKVDTVYGFYVKPKIELAPRFELFGRFGFADVSVKTSLSGYGSETGSDSGVSYGVGATYHFDKKLSLSADYMNYLDKDGVTATGFTIGLGMKF